MPRSSTPICWRSSQADRWSRRNGPPGGATRRHRVSWRALRQQGRLRRSCGCSPSPPFMPREQRRQRPRHHEVRNHRGLRAVARDVPDTDHRRVGGGEARGHGHRGGGDHEGDAAPGRLDAVEKRRPERDHELDDQEQVPVPPGSSRAPFISAHFGHGGRRSAWRPHAGLRCRNRSAQRAETSGRGAFLKAIAAALNMSTAPTPSAQPKRSDSTTTPTPIAIAGLTKA
jgi:hypothetical protein